MKNPRALMTVVGVALLIAFGFFFVRSPKPVIEIKGEELASIGPFPLLNTYLTSLVVLVTIVVVSYVACRRLSLIPSGLQNAVEAVAEALYNICIQTAGEKNGRRFFPVAATIFVFIWIANWMALLPIFNSVGAVQEVNAHHWHEEAQIFEDRGGIAAIMPFRLYGESPLVEFEVDETQVNAVEDEIAEAEARGAPAEEIEELERAKEDALLHARERAIDAQLVKASGLEVDYSECDALEGEGGSHCREEVNLAHADEAREKMEADGKELGILFPYFRSVNTDLNSPLSLAIMSVIFIEFWGITALGFFKYGSKFLNFSSPINFAVGILEFVAELARLISFTFRLFGNMLAGEILLLVMTFLIPFVMAVVFYGLELFVGAIQAFVFFILTVAFGTIAVESHDEHGEEHAGDEGTVNPEGYPTFEVQPGAPGAP